MFKEYIKFKKHELEIYKKLLRLSNSPAQIKFNEEKVEEIEAQISHFEQICLSIQFQNGAEIC